MRTEESTIKTQAIFNQNKTHRVLLKKIFDEDKPSAAILMTNPSAIDDINALDTTTMLCINHLSALGYGSVSIVNLFSLMTTKLDLKGGLDELSIKENTEQIIRAAAENNVFIIATGSITNTYKKVAAYQYAFFEKLKPFQEKIQTIEAFDGSGRNLHPLSPKCRSHEWALVPFPLPSPTDEKEQSDAQDGSGKSEKGKKGSKK